MSVNKPETFACHEERRQLLARYAELKRMEAEFSAVINAAAPYSDIAALWAAEGRLRAVRLVLSRFPDEIGAAYRPPETPHERHRRETRDALAGRVVSLRREIERVTKHELPGLELRLGAVPTPRDLGMWAGYADPHWQHTNLLNEQKAAQLARVEECRAEIERAEAEIGRIDGARESDV